MLKLQMPWGRMAYTDTGGGGTPLVLLHGTGCDSEDWACVLAALPRGLRIICLDFRGHGGSDVPAEKFTLGGLAADVLALAQHLGLQSMFLVGHSLGGIAAMAVAARSPRVAGMVLLEGWTNLRAAEAFSGQRLYGGLDEQAIRQIQEKAEVTVRRYRADVWSALGQSVGNFDGFPYLQEAAIPIVEVYGEMGKSAETEALLYIPPNPRISLIWIAGAGHYLPHERPGEVAEICRRVVAGSEPTNS